MPRRVPFQRAKLRLPRLPEIEDKALQQYLQELEHALEDLPFDFGPAFRLSRSSNLSITDNTVTTVTWNQIDEDQGFGLSGSPTSVTFPRTGWYLLSAGSVWASNNTGVRLLRLQSAEPAAKARMTASTNSEQNVCAVVRRENGDTAEVEVLQSSGGPLNLLTDTGTFFSGVWVAPLDENA